jgi:hypothetical protein
MGRVVVVLVVGGAIVMGRVVVVLVVGGAICALIILLESGRDGAIVMGRAVMVLVVGGGVVVSFGFKAGIITKIINRVITKMVIVIAIIILFFGVASFFGSLREDIICILYIYIIFISQNS